MDCGRDGDAHRTNNTVQYQARLAVTESTPIPLQVPTLAIDLVNVEVNSSVLQVNSNPSLPPSLVRPHPKPHQQVTPFPPDPTPTNTGRISGAPAGAHPPALHAPRAERRRLLSGLPGRCVWLDGWMVYAYASLFCFYVFVCCGFVAFGYHIHVLVFIIIIFGGVCACRVTEKRCLSGWFRLVWTVGSGGRAVVASLLVLLLHIHVCMRLIQSFKPRPTPQDCDCDMHCSRCSVEVVLDVSYKGKKEEEQALGGRGGMGGDAEEDSLPVNVTSADLTVTTVRDLDDGADALCVCGCVAFEALARVSRHPHPLKIDPNT